MGSWSTFRRIRIGVFVLITAISLLLTVVYALFLSKDFHRYSELQRGIVTASAAINGITAILMYLMLAVRYSTKLDALRIIILLALQAGSTALFTLHSADLPCDAFKAGVMCKRVAFYTAIVSWALCGLLVIYGACLAIMACIPHPPPILDDPELDAQVPVNAQAVTYMSIDSQVNLIDPDKETQPYSARPLPGTRIGQQMQEQRGVQRGAPFISRYPLNASPTSMQGRDGNAPYWPAADSRRMRSLDQNRPFPPSSPNADPIPRAWTQTPGSYSTGPKSSSAVNFPSGGRSGTLPPPPQFNPAQQRTRSSSLSTSVYSFASGESIDLPPPVPSIGVNRTTPHPQQIQSTGGDDWKKLVLDAAVGRREESP